MANLLDGEDRKKNKRVGEVVENFPQPLKSLEV
jgi:hypothetical protein